MKSIIVKAIIVFVVFFLGACGVLLVDTICCELTGEGGNLVLNIDNASIFK